MTYPTNSSIATHHGTTSSSEPTRRVVSMEEADNLDKTLNVLGGRAEELRERLSRVLSPAAHPASGNTQAQPTPPAGSMLTEKFRDMCRTADATIAVIEDVLVRLEV